MEQLTLHVGEETRLLERARETSQATEIVVAPVELHRRNLQRRLREANASKDPFEFKDFVGVSRTILDSVNEPTDAIDRIDRLAMVRALPDGSADSTVDASSVTAGPWKHDPQHVAQMRAEVESATNFHPERLAAWRETAAELYSPIDAENEELLDTALDVERGLRTDTSEAVSETELVRRATRTLTSTSGSAWTDAYPDVNRLTVVGLSSISAPQADFLHALVATTSLDIHVYFRECTGEYLTHRVPSLFEITDPGLEVFE